MDADEVRKNLFEAIDNIIENERRGRACKILDYSPENANDTIIIN